MFRVKVDLLEVDRNSGDGEDLLDVAHHLGTDAVARNHRHSVTPAVSKLKMLELLVRSIRAGV